METSLEPKIANQAESTAPILRPINSIPGANAANAGYAHLAESLWGPVFEPLRQPERFAEFTLSPTLHIIAWGNDADFAPEYLRDKMIEQAAAADREDAAADR